MSEGRDQKVEGILSKVYYDVASGFGSIAKTLEQARKIDTSITRGEVQSFLAKQELRQTKKRRKDNSWVSFGPREGFQIDLADFARDSEYRYALLAIDVFTKKLAVEPVKDKTSEVVGRAFEQILSELDIPNYVYSDEGGEFQSSFESVLAKYQIEHVVSRTPAAFVERAIRTVRDGISLRLEALRLPKKDWWRVLEPVVKQHNDAVHTTTGMKPDDAAKLDWDKPEDRQKILEVRSTIGGKAHSGRKYPSISVGDRVKILRKPGKYGEFKSDFRAWTKEAYEVEKISYEVGSPVFHLAGRPRPLRLHEVLKVEGVRKAPLQRVVGKQGVAARLGTAVKRKAEDREPQAAASSSSAAPPPPPSEASPSTGPERGRTVFDFLLRHQERRKRLRNKTVDPTWPRARGHEGLAGVLVADRERRQRLWSKTFDPTWSGVQV
jgi:hypothetical protein